MDPDKLITALEQQAADLKGVARDLREALNSIPYMVNCPEIMWEGIESAPTDGKLIWVSDGFDVWSIRAHEDGSHKRGAASRCKFWTRFMMPAPPSVTLHPPGPRRIATSTDLSRAEGKEDTPRG